MTGYLIDALDQRQGRMGRRSANGFVPDFACLSRGMKGDTVQVLDPEDFIPVGDLKGTMNALPIWREISGIPSKPRQLERSINSAPRKLW